MKKSFIKSLIAVGVVGAMGVTSVAMAAEASWYGSIRAGVATNDTIASASLGATGSDGSRSLGSRIGVRGSTDLGNGQSAGAQVELGVTGNGGLSTRHHNVWIGGGWGRLTLGQQNNPYNSIANWDQAWLLGGQRRVNDGGYRLEGISYSSNLAGPFSFDITVTGNDATADDVDRLIVTAHYDLGLATVNFGFNNSDAATHDKTVISANGSGAGLDWYIAYEKNDGNTGGADTNTVGLFLSYSLGASDSLYLEHERAEDQDSASVLGYSHSLGDGVTFIVEHQTLTDDSVLVLKYDF